MELEREAKFMLTNDPYFYINYLLRNGFKLADKVIDRDTYFKHPCWDMSSRDEALRIRRRSHLEGNDVEIIMSFKGPRRTTGLVKEREEYEVKIGDFEIFRTILLKLGFQEIASIVKYREIYVNNHTRVYVDHLFGVGWFMEIETYDISYVKRVYDELRDHLIAVKETYLEICLSSGRCVDKVG